ncbi:formylmethionine deformylase [Actinoplanes sp. SE50]|uniref:peptide deformylase n=1 Tax=unclassified Actinoplanes TaxID=2626549 RepID=UPI00023EDD14|nr:MULTISPECIES: peptide deformylase [unclassified Actinoplanes]AEV89127.1 N-formylmethionyl-tRNA deformylase [Actinoplanes sp. SE50/110]ATO87533.1 formylmethionine deformylase [Actinoplanes sp. SE50]SLM04951.1 formylmethionine deformylase [Actinoplanes sp. SE50/110]
MTTSPVERAADQFVSALAQWRVERGMTKKQLAARMGFDPSYVSHVEGRRHKPTEDFARRAEAVLGAGGAIWQRFQEYDELRHARTPGPHRDSPVRSQWLPPGAGLVVEREIAELAYTDGAYRCRVLRSLYNAGVEPVTRYLVKMAVDRYPNDPTGSNRHHRENPLTFEELDVHAVAGEGDAAEPMRWRVKLDRDAAKEIWLLFANERGQFPLYPGERTTIQYAYTVGEEKWGQWFQRAVRLPTRSLTVRLNLPERFEPQVWGVEVSLNAEVPVRTPLERRNEGGRAIFEWSTDQPLLNARYRLEWRFRGADAPVHDDLAPAEPVLPRASHRMRGIGIIQRGSDLLRQRARHFQLPREAPAARETVTRLLTSLAQLEDLHEFSKGVGLAAPQIGLPVAAAVVRAPDREIEPVVLLNPRVVGESAARDEQYEGCLSFFDYRGLVVRPLRIEVEHARFDGARVVTVFERALARLVGHEIDHLEGRLYVDRMKSDAKLVPVAQYQQTGRPWDY